METANHTPLRWVDALKGIAIIGVVAIHLDYAYPQWPLLPIYDLVGCAWSVAVFFLIAGFFVKEERLAKPLPFIRRKLTSIYLKLVLTYFIAIVLHNALLKAGWYSPVHLYGGRHIEPYSFLDMLKACLLTVVGAGRESILTPMWFVYVLFAAFCFLSILTWGLRRLIKDERLFQWTRGGILLALCIMGHMLGNVFGIVIPRYGCLFSAAWLIYLGMMLRQHLRVEFLNWRLALAAVPVFYLCCVVFGSNKIALNEYHNVLSMTLCALSALYCLAYLCRRFEQGWAVGALAFVGRYSFYIMAWHLLSFKAASMLLCLLGQPAPVFEEWAVYFPHPLFLFYYLTIGVALPILAARLIHINWHIEWKR